jgi:hypothetical protein
VARSSGNSDFVLITWKSKFACVPAIADSLLPQLRATL